MYYSEDKHIFGETQLLYIFTDIIYNCENVNIELCTRFLSYNNFFCRTISVCNARSTITMFPKHDCCDIY